MQHLKGGPAPFFLSMCTPRLRDDALLTRALEAFQAGYYADALLAAEYVCRRLPLKSIPAMLRAKVLQTGYPFMAARAWHAAWLSDAENPVLQDAMLQSWLQDGGRADVASLGPAFLPARCQAGRHASLLPLLRAAGVAHTGACWKDGDAIAGMVFLNVQAGASAPRAKLLLSDETRQYQVEIPADGSRFRLACPKPGAVWSVTLVQPDGKQQLLPGSPLAFYAPPVIQARQSDDDGFSSRPVSIVIPVYRELALVQACLNSVLASLKQNQTPARVVVIDDASPEPALSAWLDKQATAGLITLLRNPRNLGFIETTNRGMREFPDHDVLLLNADTQVHADWIDRLKRALYAEPDIASVTPWTNNGEISSFPLMSQAASAPDLRELATLDDAAARVRAMNGGSDIELPSCCGFTMLIRRPVLDAIGMLDGTSLIRGYGEEVDWCMRARAAGWRHLQATGVFVTHAGTVSFRAEKTLRVVQNRRVLLARFPSFYPEFSAFRQNDPLSTARAALRLAVERSCAANWLRKADTAQQPATLPLVVAKKAMPTMLQRLRSSSQRIAIWNHDVRRPAAHQVLALARLVASKPDLQVRLLVFGDSSEALWHTGVVDLLPRIGDDAHLLLDDSRFLQIAGCNAVLTDDPTGLPSKLRPVSLDERFDATAWLKSWSNTHSGVKVA
ncbi:glycosyltransferase [Pseudoduganella umbonata]|uniref:Glycosyltransferase n=1 Tax=Pseudoduganella umbonata TaxID=864828 RepID=A0A4V1EDL0_9BURK|nr:glycosyltransferase [Pseudoduganella umbonata]MBB3225079.1 GT2 family glycosyltransferase [Pseudoduganella umbonata]QCP11451.1 glycosyltransferase [Pseudoduganella umbonata]